MKRDVNALKIKPGSHRSGASIVHERQGAGKGPDVNRPMGKVGAVKPGHEVVGASFTFDPKPKLGSGARFKALKSKLASRPGVKDPGALAAYIGRKKYGAKKFAALGKKGK